MILEDGIILYHGSYCVVENPDLNKCKPGKDFGLGFYVTTDQICFRTKNALKCLEFVGSIEVKINEKK